jgi:hypothetical protein
MSAEYSKTTAPKIASIASIAKDIVALLRDSTIFLLAVLLLAFPSRLNTMLVDAGFEEGSIVGFRWKSKLVTTNQDLQSAQQQISSLQKRNDELTGLLSDANVKAADPGLKERLAQLEADNDRLNKQSLALQTNIPTTIDSNIPLIERATASADSTNTATDKRYYVIALTSARREDIDNEIRNVRERVSKAGGSFETMFPDIQAYAPTGGLYTLLINGRSLPFTQASRLKKTAIAAGFSASTWLWQSDVGYFADKRD